MAGIGSLSPSTYRVARGIAIFTPKGGNFAYVLGDMDNFAITLDIEREERFTNEFAVKRKAFSYVSQLNATVALTLAQIGEFARAAYNMGAVEVLSQDAQAGQSVDVPGVRIGDLINLKAIKVDVTAVKSGATAFVEGQHYTVDEANGIVTIIAKPAGVATAKFPINVAFDVQAIADGLQWKLFGGGGLRGQLTVIESVLPNSGRVPRRLDMWDVELAPTGDRTWIGGDGLATIQLQGEIYTDQTRPEGYELGREIDVPTLV